MGDSARELAHGFHPLGLPQFLLETPPPGHVAADRLHRHRHAVAALYPAGQFEDDGVPVTGDHRDLGAVRRAGRA